MGNGLSKSGSTIGLWTKKSTIKDKKVGNQHNETRSETSTPEFVESKASLESLNLDATKHDKCNLMNMSELYNIVIAETWHGTPQIAEADSILLLDCRDEEEYLPAHVITARHWCVYNMNDGFVLSQMARYQLIVLCVSKKSMSTQQIVSDRLGESGLAHYILDCSVSVFLARYPFLTCSDPCTNMQIPSNRLKTMPSEIIVGRLYQGNANQAKDLSVISSLGISHIVNITMEQPNKFPDQVQYLKVPLDDSSDEDLLTLLPKIISFIESAILKNGSGDTKPNATVLVHCNLGRSRSSAAVLGYLMSVQHMSLLEAGNFLKDCRPTAKPNVGFLEQLLRFERTISESKSTFSDLPF